MANKGLRTFDDIMDYLTFLEKKYDDIEAKIAGIKIGFFNPDKKKLKQRKEVMTEELYRISDTYDYYDKFFREATTFDRKDLAVFIAEIFKATSGKPYGIHRGVKDISDSKYAVVCDFIASYEDFKRIDELFNMNAPTPLNDVISLCQDNCISLGGNKKHVILNDSEMHSDFAEFPEIIEAAKRLIDAKLAYPNMSDKERLDYVLSEYLTELELKRQEKALGASVRREAEPRTNVIRKETVQKESPVAAESVVKVPQQVSKTVVESQQPEEDLELEAMVQRALLNMQILVGQQSETQESKVQQPMPQQSEVVSPSKIYTQPSGGTDEKKLSKSLMGRYMNRK